LYLQVDPADLAISLVDASKFEYAIDFGELVPLADRTLLVASAQVVHVSLGAPFASGRKFQLVCGPQEPLVGLTRPPRLVAYRGLVYAPGQEWYVIDPTTLRAERLGTGVAMQGRLDDFNTAYGILSGYGLVGICDGTLYHFFTRPPVKSPTTGLIASAAPTVRPAEFEPAVGPLPNYPGFGFEVRAGLAKLWITGTEEGTHCPSFQTADPAGTLRPAVEWMRRYPEDRARIGLSAADWDQIEKTTQRFAAWNSPEARIQCMTLFLAWHDAPAGPAQDACAKKVLDAVRDVGEQAWQARIQEEQALRAILTPERLRILHYQVPVEEPK
jgi:hypothetical protein